MQAEAEIEPYKRVNIDRKKPRDSLDERIKEILWQYPAERSKLLPIPEGRVLELSNHKTNKR